MFVGWEVGRYLEGEAGKKCIKLATVQFVIVVDRYKLWEEFFANILSEFLKIQHQMMM